MGRSLREENQISDLKPYVQSVLIILGFSIWQFAYKSDAGRDGGQEEKGMTEDKMAGSHHQLDGHEFEWTPRVGDGQGGLLLLLLSRLSRVQLCATPEMAAHQAPPSLRFSRQEHWSGLPFPSPVHESEKWKWSRSAYSIVRDPMDCSLPGSSVHGIFQARVLEWGAIAFSVYNEEPLKKRDSLFNF